MLQFFIKRLIKSLLLIALALTCFTLVHCLFTTFIATLSLEDSWIDVFHYPNAMIPSFLASAGIAFYHYREYTRVYKSRNRFRA